MVPQTLLHKKSGSLHKMALEPPSLLLGLASIPCGWLFFKSFITVAFQNKIVYLNYFPPGSRSRIAIPSFVRRVAIPGPPNLDIWVIQAKKSRPEFAPTILYFPGNAGNLSHRTEHFSRLKDLVDVNVVAIHYRGFGPSEGRPSEAGIAQDAQRLLSLCNEIQWIRKDALFAYGHSLGGAVAVDLAAKFPGAFRGLILENTFTSVEEMVLAMFPKWSLYPKLTPFLWNHWRSVDKIAKVNCPILFAVGGKDEVVPREQSEKLFKLSKSGMMKVFPRGMHDTTWKQEHYEDVLKNFIQQCMNKEKCHN